MYIQILANETWQEMVEIHGILDMLDVYYFYVSLSSLISKAISEKHDWRKWRMLLWVQHRFFASALDVSSPL